MTTGMDDRRDAFEKKFALDAELRFKAEARRNKLLGLWVADQLGKKDGDAEAYAKEVVAADFEEAGDEDVFRKVRADFDAAGVSVADDVIREKMLAFLEEAIRQVKQD
ncbi:MULTISPECIES: DUF1476 domain-containing protein [Brucella/Ochrobactrum group]|uniref:DUF1476 domain-containing protein n=1 Tax=Brucella/Ochrobactrum group TaxID=2826938 RepID=UPI001122EF97|nr:MULTISPECIES: DUF1476 domain-containing protein [Brucella/Ochrobactrum group]